jgi:mRNA deadenylase 3'-5' endonuclease subunit Ccr4
MQEVERDVFAALQEGFSARGYHGNYAPKVGSRPDGCAIFFRADDFDLVSEQTLVYADGVGAPPSGHIAQILYLEHESRHLALLNTHLKWDPPGTPCNRQWGRRQASEAIRALAGAPCGDAAKILCGDFNVTPDSPVIELFREADFDYAHRSCPSLFTCNSNGQPKLIDYLFHNPALHSKPLPSMQIDAKTPLPSTDCPSDHLPLVAEFEWAGRSDLGSFYYL